MNWNLLILVVSIMVTAPLLVDAKPSSDDWIVDAPEAVAMLENATVLDTRGLASFGFGHVAASQRVSWKSFTPSKKAARGTLVAPEKVSAKLRKLGVSNDRAVLVYGDPVDGWGEDGRIVWMLRALGHEKTYLVDGGYDALVSAGADTTLGPSGSATKGDFVARPTTRFSAAADEVKDADHVFDTREEREFLGKTPYGESRGGHVPGAHHLYYRALMTEDGEIHSAKNVHALMKKFGVEKKDDIVVYCTGGVRSGWFVVVLQHLGYRNARNYAGSMWEWSSLDPTSHPLQKGAAAD